MKNISIIFLIISFNANSQLTVGQIYNYNVGDVFQKLRTPYGSIPPTYITDTVVYKTVLVDTLKYAFHQYNYQLQSCLSCSPSISRNTYSVSYPHTSAIFSVTPTLLSDCPSTISTYFKDSVLLNGYCSRMTHQNRWSGNIPAGWVTPCYIINSNYTEGLGLTYLDRNTSAMINPLDFNLQMIYFNKGGITCGNFYSVGIYEMELKNYVSFYPNPANDFLIIDLSKINSLENSFKIIDLSGKSIFNLNSTQLINKINVSEIEKGLYFFEIKTNENIISRFKFVKE